MDIIIVYFFYGLSFFSMGLAIQLEVGRSSELDFAHALRYLAGFGIIHGIHEWIEMFFLIYPQVQEMPFFEWVGLGRVIMLSVSFLFLITFGAKLVVGPERSETSWQMLGAIVIFWVAGLVWLFLSEPPDKVIVAADVYTRYSLAIPGAGLTAWGLYLQRQKFLLAGMKGFGRDMIIAAVAFGLYGGIGQLFAARSVVFPSALLNADTFLAWFGFRIQLFRSLAATAAAISIISSLRAFEEETQRRIRNLGEAQRVEHQRLEDLRESLLRQTVRAQELERQRIARELHDEIGQTLTALGMGIRATTDAISSRPDWVKVQLHELQGVVASGLSGLQNLITGLHPPQLDDLGLVPALRWYTSHVEDQLGLKVFFHSEGESSVLPEEMRTVLYRIVQEGITNVIRHAKVNQAQVLIHFGDDEVHLRIEDKGCGFDVEATLDRQEYPCWGLLGIMERASLVGGKCTITSSPGNGTRIAVSVPLQKEGSHA
jgi:signal transduction histidine kinase